MMKKLFFLSFTVVLFAACGGNNKPMPTIQATPLADTAQSVSNDSTDAQIDTVDKPDSTLIDSTSLKK